jgi:hypothetical protein
MGNDHWRRQAWDPNENLWRFCRAEKLAQGEEVATSGGDNLRYVIVYFLICCTVGHFAAAAALCVRSWDWNVSLLDTLRVGL